MSGVRFKQHESSLGADALGVDLSQPLSESDAALILGALSAFGVLRFPGQNLQPDLIKAFASRFGTLEVNVAGAFQEPGMPEVMTTTSEPALIE